MTTTKTTASKSVKIVPNKGTAKSSVAAAKEAKLFGAQAAAQEPKSNVAAPKKSAPVKKEAAPATKSTGKTTAPKSAPAPKVKSADASEMVTLRLPKETRESGDGRWVITPNHKGRERWFDTNKASVSAKMLKNGIWEVTLPRGEAAHRQCLDFVV